MPAFKSLGHIALRVNDLERSLEFYRKLGFEEFLRLTQTDGRPWIAYLKITDELYIELFPGGNGEGVAGPERTGVNHLCLTTDDIEQTAAHLKSVGIEASSPLVPEHRGVDGNRGMWVTDPDGNRIEIMEMAANCVQYEAIHAVGKGEPSHSLVRPL